MEWVGVAQPPRSCIIIPVWVRLKCGYPSPRSGAFPPPHPVCCGWGPPEPYLSLTPGRSLRGAQAQELYAGRAGISMDTDRLLAGAGAGLGPGGSSDTPDFCSLMESYMAPSRVAASVGGPPNVMELLGQLGHGSAVTALDELPKSLLRHVVHAGLAALVEVLQRLSQGDPSALLNGVLHLCLRKREPSWLLKNSRPVLLEPYLRRLESSVVFRRLQRSMELNGTMPSSMLAYRRQLSPQYAAMVGRLLLAHWTAMGHEVHIADWDEENAFCNVPRGAAAVVAGTDAPELAPWLQQFYGAMDVYVVTPHGLAGPYHLQHGGAQGDSMGVGWYLYVGMRRTEYHRGVLTARLHPSAERGGGPPPGDICFCAPYDRAALVPEVGYSDDRRFFSKSPDGLAHLLEVAAHGCWSAGGVVNGSKLQIFSIKRVGARMVYCPGHIDTVLGPLDCQSAGLALCKIPMLAGEVPADAMEKTLARDQPCPSGSPLVSVPLSRPSTMLHRSWECWGGVRQCLPSILSRVYWV
jgi:hypothetical protein